MLLFAAFTLVSCCCEDDYPVSLRGLWTSVSLDPDRTFILNVSQESDGTQHAFVIVFSSDFSYVKSTTGEFFYNPETGIGLINSEEAAEASVTFTVQAYKGDNSKIALTISDQGDVLTQDLNLLGTAIDFPTGVWTGQILIQDVMYDARLEVFENPTESNFGTFTLTNGGQSNEMPIIKLTPLARPFFSKTGAYGIYIVQDKKLPRITTVRYDVESKRMWIIFEGGTSDMEFQNK